MDAETQTAVESSGCAQGVSCAPEAGEAFSAFVDTIAALRAPGGCPWDREQTHASIARNMIEEAYEAVDAIERKQTAHLREELGDVLLQVVLQSQIAADAGEFSVADVCRDVNEKMIRRHPHVFGEHASAQSAEEVLDIWDAVKLTEKSTSDAEQGAQQPTQQPAGLLDSVPVSFPALLQAYKISRKAVSVGFEWDSVDAVWDQVKEEVAEYQQALQSGDKQAMELEFGDILFSLVNVARKSGIDAEMALRASCNKFRDRWAFMEGVAWSRGVSLESLNMTELQALWDEAKQHAVQCAGAATRSGEGRGTAQTGAPQIDTQDDAARSDAANSGVSYGEAGSAQSKSGKRHD